MSTPVESGSVGNPHLNHITSTTPGLSIEPTECRPGTVQFCLQFRGRSQTRSLAYAPVMGSSAHLFHGGRLGCFSAVNNRDGRRHVTHSTEEDTHEHTKPSTCTQAQTHGIVSVVFEDDLCRHSLQQARLRQHPDLKYILRGDSSRHCKRLGWSVRDLTGYATKHTLAHTVLLCIRWLDRCHPFRALRQFDLYTLKQKYRLQVNNRTDDSATSTTTRAALPS